MGLTVLDTNVLSACMGRAEEPLRRLAEHRPGDLVLCTPVAAEIAFGLSRLPPRSRRCRILAAEYRPAPVQSAGANPKYVTTAARNDFRSATSVVAMAWSCAGSTSQ
jgi:hypothetical protein